MHKRVNIKMEWIKRVRRHRDLASRLQARGFNVDTDDVSRLIAGRWTPPEDIRRTISEILGRPAYELFQDGARV